MTQYTAKIKAFVLSPAYMKQFPVLHDLYERTENVVIIIFKAI